MEFLFFHILLGDIREDGGDEEFRILYLNP